MDEEKKQERRVEIVEGKLSKIIHVEGEGESPKKGQEVFALYRGTLENGSEFDSNQDRENPFKFTIGQGQVIKGWDEGFASMRKGEKATLICSPEYAYGARGSPPKIPPNSTLNFEVELLDFQDKKKQKWEKSTEEKVEEAKKQKQLGNELLKKSEFAEAVKHYTYGIEQVEDEDDESAKAILKILRMNASQAYLKLKEYRKAIENCDKILKEDDKNVKSLYRRAEAYLGSQQFEKAKSDANKILEIDPSSVEAKQELIKIASAKKAAEAQDKKLFGSMFSKSGLYDDKKPEKKKEVKKVESDSEDDGMPDLEKDEQNNEEMKDEEKSEPKQQSKKPQAESEMAAEQSS